MLALMLAALVVGQPRRVSDPPDRGHRLVVGSGSPLATVTDALARARDGDTILVRAGTYREPELVVTHRVVLLGEGRPVLEGGPHQILRIQADSVTVRGLVFHLVVPSATEDRAAIKVLRAHGCRLEDNTLLDTFFGIYLSEVDGCTVRGNLVRGSGTTEVLSGNAIHSWSSGHLVIEDNVLEGHRDGLYFEFTTNTIVRHNRSTRALRYGLHFMFSHDCTYTDNIFANNRTGVAVMYSHGVRMEGNRFEHSWGGAAHGLLLKDITDSQLLRNRFEDNTVGLFAEGTNRLEVTDNEFLRNGWGVQIMADAQDASFRHNRFEGNSFDVSTNSVHATTRFEGNYWDRYTGYDLDRDGTGDIPFAPVRLFALVVQQNQPALILLRSFFVSLLEGAERVAPVLTPQTMVDGSPLMTWRPT
jgi:nitrous oxidase accessory protein